MTARPRPLLGSVLLAALALSATNASASTPALDSASIGIAPSAPRTSPLDRAPELVTFKLRDAGRLALLRAYFDAEVERPGPYTRYFGGQYGRWTKQPWLSLAWGEHPAPQGATAPEADTLDRAAAAESSEDPDELAGTHRAEDWVHRLFVTGDRAPSHDDDSATETPLEAEDPLPGASVSMSAQATLPTSFWTTGPSLASNGFDRLWAPPPKPVNDWRCRRRPVQFIRFGGENDRLSLVQCSGAIEIGAVDRVSILARPPEVPDPGELPEEPDPDAWEKGGEWLPRVKLVNPRLVWLLQKIADAFPHRAVYIYSGYRPHKDKSVLQGHHSMHGDGRAVDIQVHGVRNEALFAYCRKLDDVGCGYYPNSKFVHVDVRKPGTGHAFWIDASGPGEPSRYVDSWPGVIEHGALAWMQVPAREMVLQGPRPRSPDDRGSADVIRK